MSKKVVVISISPRIGSNSHALAAAFVQGAQQAGHPAQLISLHDKTINFCQGCLACQQSGQCTITDDTNHIIQQMQTADVIAFATPIYYYEMCGQMKTLLDRANPLFAADYAFRDIYLLTAAADEEEDAANGAMHGLNGWISCFEKCALKGVVSAGGVTDINQTTGHPAMEKAFTAGQNI